MFCLDTCEKIVPTLVNNDWVEEILELHGQFVAMLKLSADSLADLRETINNIGKLPHVTRTEMSAILKVWKEP